jgi:hypothetical protein
LAFEAKWTRQSTNAVSPHPDLTAAKILSLTAHPAPVKSAMPAVYSYLPLPTVAGFLDIVYIQLKFGVCGESGIVGGV